MNFEQFTSLFDTILGSTAPGPPYDNPDYHNYTRLNQSRLGRWKKTGELDGALVETLAGLEAPQHWIIIVEPWCGDVAPSLPFIVRLVDESPMLSYELQLRDSAPFLINQYLTAGGKSIPKLIARDSAGNDLFTWGPRPAAAQELMTRLRSDKADFETIKVSLQNWYNEDKGRSLQKELLALVKAV